MGAFPARCHKSVLPLIFKLLVPNLNTKAYNFLVHLHTWPLTAMLTYVIFSRQDASTVQTIIILMHCSILCTWHIHLEFDCLIPKLFHWLCQMNHVEISSFTSHNIETWFMLSGNICSEYHNEDMTWVMQCTCSKVHHPCLKQIARALQRLCIWASNWHDWWFSWILEHFLIWFWVHLSDEH